MVVDTPLVYLAGAMENAKDFGEGWRGRAAESLRSQGLRVFNPAEEEHFALRDFNNQHPEMAVSHPRELRPFKQVYTIREYIKAMRSIARHDLSKLEQSDVVLVALSDVASGGTAGELTYAHYFMGIPVIGFLEGNLGYNDLADISGWVLGCCNNIFQNQESAEDAILQILKTQAA